MPIVKTLRRGLKHFYGALLALYVMAPAYAFSPAQVPLLSAPAVPPNLMLLMDDSGSMNNIIWSSSFNPSDTTLPTIWNCSGFCQTVTADNILLGNLYSGGCGNGASNYYNFYIPNTKRYVCLILPDPVGNKNTYYTAKYLAWLVKNAPSDGDYTKGAIPVTFRMGVAKAVATDLVTNNPNIRFGLAALNPDGGKKIVKDVVDISGKTNSDALKLAIKNLTPGGGTPLAETYYEITRYFRGMPSAYSSSVSYTSPIQYRCQKNYGVVVTDGLPSGDNSFPQSNDTDAAGKLPDWDGRNNDGPKVNSSADGDTLYLDDIAKFAYDIDMRVSKTTADVDLAKKSWDASGFVKQNLLTYTVGFTVANQMLIDAAAYGNGQYYQANDAVGLTAALTAALSDINARAGSGGGGAASSSTLVSGTQFYQTLYDPVDWHGTIKAYNLDSTTGATTTVAWNTDTTVVNTAAAPVYQSMNTATSKPIGLNYGEFSPAQQAALNLTVATSQFSQYGIIGADLIAWAKGTNKNGLRQRTRLLGDIINSPLVAALPTSKTAADLANNTDYTTYLSTKASSMPYNLIVNANDGFMHVISADKGIRQYAYMPSTVLPSLISLSSLDYGSGMHKFTVDGQIAVLDVKASSAAAWQTVAFGGTGAGGKAYYAVNLFGGSSNAIGALWEVSAPVTPDATNKFNDLGYAYSKADVANMADGTGIVAIGNGYGSSTGLAALYILNAATGAFIAEIAIPARGETDNGLSSVKLLTNSQNVVQAAYAGDLKGRMWKFDLSAASASAWKVAYGTAANPIPLFTAPRGAAQPITVQPLLLDHPSNNGKMVYFGTGKFLETADKTTTDLQDFYAIWDHGVSGLVESNLQAQAVTTSISGSGTNSGNTYFRSTTNDVDWATKSGWYMPLASALPYLGERIIYPAQTTRGRIVFTTAAVNSADPCESTGTGRVFELDAAKGGMLNYQVLDTNGDSDITDTDTMVAGLAVNTGIPNLAAIVAGVAPTNDNKYIIDSSGGGVTKLLEKGGTSNVYQRIMWRQIQ
ncbi:pilus assembly protein [Pseudomonas syringae]|uniref:Pilus assembly protein n=1 Tax=Pseudomonas syringae TaxID=317 RepID=A0A085ULR0_PSESX|nr:PilC/PilY family type IV pilus protein [Pseudomonas syringae]KFE44123.1 pilus assembly protein [Pseudomonas syringae]